MIATHFKVWSHNNAFPSPTQSYPSTACALLCQMCNSATIFSVYHISNIYWSFNKGLYINYVTVFLLLFLESHCMTVAWHFQWMVFACIVFYVQPLMLSIAQFKDCSFHFALSEYYCQWHFQISPCVQFYHQLNSIPFGIWLLFCFHLQLTFK